MDSAYGTGIDPTPYMFAAYGIGTILLVGYTLTIFMARSKVRRLIAAMNTDKHSNSKDNAYGTKR